MDLHLWLGFVLASAVLVAIPGPTVLLVLSYALSRGRPVALSTAAGVAMGDLVAMSASLAGLGALLASSATLFTLLKWCGAAYLVWLGVKLWRTPPRVDLAPGESAGITARSTFFHAATVTALNPKSIGFFIAFVPQFLDPGRPLAPQSITLVLTFVSIGAANALLWALVGDRLRSRVGSPRMLTVLGRAGGATMIGMGLLTTTLRRSS